jgi:tRNA threonylcarbamoyl adenosine modification protein YjeE
MTLQKRTLITPSPAATVEVATRLASLLKPSDVVLLEGRIGAGKSFLTRTLIQHSQDHPEDVPSPTFTLVQEYETNIGPVWHADLYRLSGPDEVIELGLIDAFEEALCFVEWPDRLNDLAPKDALTITLTHLQAEDSRSIEFTWTTGAWASRLDPVFQDQWI